LDNARYCLRENQHINFCFDVSEGMRWVEEAILSSRCISKLNYIYEKVRKLNSIDILKNSELYYIYFLYGEKLSKEEIYERIMKNRNIGNIIYLGDNYFSIDNSKVKLELI